MPAIMNAYRGCRERKPIISTKVATKQCANEDCGKDIPVTQVARYCDTDCGKRHRDKAWRAKLKAERAKKRAKKGES